VVVVLGLWCLRRELPAAAFLPFGAAGACIAARFCGRCPSLASFLQLAASACWVCLRSLAFCVSMARRALRRPARLLRWAHPLEPGPHIVLTCVAVLLCFKCTSNVPVMLLWVVHICLLAVCVVERLAFRRLQWRQGLAWWYMVQISALSVYVANMLCDFPRGVGEPDRTWLAVLGTSSAWLAAVCAAAMSANWSLCLRQYQLWQRQHSVFTLSAPAARVVPVVPPV